MTRYPLLQSPAPTRVGQVLLPLLLAGLLTAAAFAQAPAPDAHRQPSVPPSDGVWRFDFGTAASVVESGWYAVRPDTAYSSQQGFGLLPDPGARRLGFDQGRRSDGGRLVLDGVTCDGMYGAGSFRVDLPNGRYRVAVLSGQYYNDETNRPDSHTRPYAIKANEVTVYEQEGTFDEFYRPDGRYFASYQHDWEPTTNLFRTYLARFLPWGEADVQVAAGYLTVNGSLYYGPINALLIFPASSEAGAQALRATKQLQEETLNNQFPYLPCQPEHPMPSLPPAVEQGGALMYVRDDAEHLRPGTRPAPRDLGRPLRLFAAQGEREAGVVAVTPLHDIVGPVTLAVTDLVGAGGVRIPASALDLRYLKYTEYPVTAGYEVRPFFAVPWHPKHLQEGITRGFWVDLFTPEEAPPGLYGGTLLLTGPGLNASLPVQVRVLPLRLPPARLRAGVYAYEVQSTTFRALYFANALPREVIQRVTRTRMQFLAAQGFTGLFDSLPWYPAKLVNGEIIATDAWQRWQDILEIVKAIPAFRDRIYSYYLAGPQFYPPLCPHWLDRDRIRGMNLDDIRFSDEAIAEMTRATQWLYGRLRAGGYPELIFYVQDELGNDGVKGARYGRELLRALNKVRRQVPGGFTTCLSTLGIADAREYMSLLDITIPNGSFPLTKETLAELHQSGTSLGLYNLGASRFSYGFYPWRVGALLRAEWSFTFDHDVADPFAAIPSGARVSCDGKFTPDWQVLPSIGLLVAREGVDDYRYLQLLQERLIAAGEAGRRDEPVSRAKAVLADLREAVSETFLDPANNWDISTMNYYRWRVAQAAIALQ